MTTMTRYLLAASLLAGSTLASAEPLGDSGLDLSANVALTSDYTFRGISQTDEEPAIQGGFDLTHTSGLYVSTWASNVDFDDGDEATIEIDYYGGVAKSFGGLGVNIGAVYFSYPGADDDLDYDYVEGYASASYTFGLLTVDGGVDLSPEFFGDSGDAQHYYSGVSVPLGDVLTASGQIGRQEIDDNAAFGADDYVHWKLGLGATIGRFGVEIAYIDTDLDETECFGGSDLCDARAQLTVSGSF